MKMYRGSSWLWAWFAIVAACGGSEFSSDTAPSGAGGGGASGSSSSTGTAGDATSSGAAGTGSGGGGPRLDAGRDAARDAGPNCSALASDLQHKLPAAPSCRTDVVGACPDSVEAVSR